MLNIDTIPQRFIDGFKAMATIDDKLFGKIEQALSNAPLSGSIPELVTHILTSVKEVAEDDIAALLYSAGSLCTFIETEENISEIANEIANIAVNDEIIESSLQNKLEKHLYAFLRSKQLFYASKVNGLLTEYGNLFLRARIVTDIRPVFGIRPEEAPEAGVIIHNLHIHYQAHSEGDHKDFYIALDSKDIQILKAALERAEAKEKSLQQLYEKTGLINLTK